MIGQVLGMVVVVDNGMEGFTVEWLAKHVTSGALVHSEGLPDGLRKMADELEAAEERRAGLPD